METRNEPDKIFKTDRCPYGAIFNRAAYRFFLLRFLDGQFMDVLDNGLNKSAALGWTGTFMKQGIALYLLYLYEGQWNSGGSD